MQSKQTLQELEAEMWELKKQFLKIIEPYRSDLFRYCLSLTKSPWDAEDLVQETLLKAFASLGQIWQSLVPKHYLFRIATNTWLNQQRKQKGIETEFSEAYFAEEAQADRFEVHSAMETLVGHLPPRQVVAVLLIDVFDFTAREAADMMGTTEGAVKAALFRARTTLKSHHQQEHGAEVVGMRATKGIEQSERKSALIQAFVDAFNRRDPEALASLLAEDSQVDILHVGKEFGRETSRKWSIADTFKDPSIELQRAERCTLWGRQVIAILIQEAGHLCLNDIIDLEGEVQEINQLRHYYFCADFLQLAAAELELPLQRDKSYMMDSV